MEKGRTAFDEFLREGFARVAFYFYTTYGVPPDVLEDECPRFRTKGEYLVLLDSFMRAWPSAFVGFKSYEERL